MTGRKELAELFNNYFGHIVDDVPDITLEMISVRNPALKQL